jgi:low temperature requirement protein LtrA
MSHDARSVVTPPVRGMVARSPHEPHRTATPLELFFDLVFVIAVAEASRGLHHGIAEAHTIEALGSFALSFFALWWAWVNFTWFASAYDCDDVPYRLLVLVQMTGALIVAAGIPAVFETHQAGPIAVAGYVVMRLAGVTQWLRAARADPPRKMTAFRYAGGIAVLQVAWIAMLFLPAGREIAAVVLIAGEMAVPAWAESAAPTPWHPHHIAERHGLFTLIVLGESVLAATVAVQAGRESGETLAHLAPTIAGGLLTVFSMWWIYFDRPAHDLLTAFWRTFRWAYAHYFILASAAAVGAGLAVNVDVVMHKAHIGPAGAGFAVAIPVAIFVLMLWAVHRRPEDRRTWLLGPVAAAGALLMPLTPAPVLGIGLWLAAIVTVKHAMTPRHAAAH